ncbi:MAG: tryptophan synthase subunit beta [Polyangiaceae bacterium]
MKGFYGKYGGRFVPETLVEPLDELERCFEDALADEAFGEELAGLLRDYVGRPTPLYEGRATSRALGFRVFLKREDLTHTGAHKINATVGQAMLAARLGKRRVIAETGAGQHGVATASAAALLGLACDVYMGERDMERQAPNVLRMRALGARVIPVRSGSRTLKDALNEALRDWVTNVRTTHYVLGTVAGPDPFPRIVRHFQSVIGREARAQIQARIGGLPKLAIACVGGGSNAIGLFSAFLGDPVRLVAVEAGGRGLESGAHGAALARGAPGILHGSRSYVLQDDDGQIAEAHSISAGLDYPGVGPELSMLRDEGRVTLAHATDEEALAAAAALARREGILPALESAHALAALERLHLDRDDVVLVNLSGRGDKDLGTYASHGLGAAGGAP